MVYIGRMEKIRVAFFADILIKTFDGATRTMFNIIERIDRDTFNYLFFTGVPPISRFPFEVFHVPAVTIPFQKTYKMASVFMMGPEITEKLDRFGPDVIHISTPSPLGYFALKYAREKNIPVLTIYHTHYLSYVKYYTKDAPLITEALEGAVTIHNRSFYNRCDLVYIPTDEMIRQLMERNFRTDNMKIWKRGINTDLFNPGKKDMNFIRRITGNENPNILYVGRLVWEKNLDTLCDIYDRIQSDELPYNLVLAGDGVARQELEKRMPNAFILGHVEHDKLAKLYASSDYFVFPSDTETYGNVVAEAMASGAVCVVANGGGVKNFIRDGQNGFLCKVNDADDYLRMINLVEHQPVLKQALSRQAMNDVKDLTWDKLTDQYFNDIRSLSNVKLTH